MARLTNARESWTLVLVAIVGAGRSLARKRAGGALPLPGSVPSGLADGNEGNPTVRAGENLTRRRGTSQVMHDVIVTAAQQNPVLAGTVTPGPFGIIHYLPNGPGCPHPSPLRAQPGRGIGYARCARLWNPVAVHLLPADRSDHRVIDAERICQAIAALDSPEAIQARARQFALLADPTRLTLLTCIRAAEPISVSDLAAATGINDATVSQTLRYLRASQTVIAERDGRVVRYRLASTPITALLAGQ
jgi:DNA-binding transcriptional ArsR family regulator